jgi:hypothetical protein
LKLSLSKFFVDEKSVEVLEYSSNEKFLKYEGQVTSGKPQGRGNMTFKDGGFYFGKWQDGERHGKGSQKYSKDSNKDTYDGTWKNDLEDGHGRILYKNGQTYEGSMVNGLRNGLGLHTYPKNDVNNRSSYDGEWKEDERSGNGTFIWKTGEEYVGEFLNGMYHGHGVNKYPENDAFNRTSYDGEWKEDERSGNGTFIWKTGEIYVGEFLNGLFHGHGVNKYPENDAFNRTSYDGEWKEDERSGNGTFIWKTGKKYVGNFLNDLYHGHGVLTYPEDDKFERASYDGEWKEDKKSGNGTMIWKSGQKYVGAWSNDLYHGHGILTYPKDDKFERASFDGEWKENKKSGNGTIIWKSGQKYVGEWLDNLRNGHGVNKYPENDVYKRVSYDGEWKEDKRSGNGTIIWKTGEKYVGEWLNDMKHGHGVYTFAEDLEAQSYNGEWKEDNRSGNGMMIWKTGEMYVGEWLDNLRYGHGFNKYPENDVYKRVSYDGEWKENERSGNGTFIWKTGEKYIGEWLNNLRQGHGILTYSEDDERASYDGEWKEDEASGNGTLTWKNREKYVGEWLNGLYHGHGVWTFADHSTAKSYDGEWKEGQSSGTGTMIWKNGEKYVGEFKDGLRDGEGIQYSATNTIINQGHWEKDTFTEK